MVRIIASRFDILLTIIFLLESCMKTFAYGFIFCGKNSYLRYGWNSLDFGIVAISTISLFNSFNLSILKILRLLRVTRPLKMISRNEMLRISISSLFRAVPQTINVILITFLNEFYLLDYWNKLTKRNPLFLRQRVTVSKIQLSATLQTSGTA